MKKFNLALIDSSGTKMSKFEINLHDSPVRYNTDENKTNKHITVKKQGHEVVSKPTIINKGRKVLSNSVDIKNSSENLHLPKHIRTNSAKTKSNHHKKLESPGKGKVMTPKFKKFPLRLSNHNNPPLVPKLGLANENKLTKSKLEFTFNSSLTKCEAEKKLFPSLFSNSIKFTRNLDMNNLRPLQIKEKNTNTIKAKLINFHNLKRFKVQLGQKCSSTIILNENSQTMNKNNDKEKDSELNLNLTKEENNSSVKEGNTPLSNKIDKTFKRPPSIKTIYSTDKVKTHYKSGHIQRSLSNLLSPSEGENFESTVFSSGRQINSNGGSLRGTPKIIKNHPHIKKFFD